MIYYLIFGLLLIINMIALILGIISLIKRKGEYYDKAGVLKDNILSIQFDQGRGLCNKLFCLFSACDIAIKDGIQLLEPFMGWEKKIKFSDIYDLSYFNKQMKKYNNGKDIIIPIEKKSQYKIIPNKEDLWGKSEKILGKQRGTGKMNKNCMNIVVLKALRLNTKNMEIVDSFTNINNLNAIHIRLEAEWVPYAEGQKKSGVRTNWSGEKETYVIDLETLANMYKQKWSKDIIFATGENRRKIQNKLKHFNINNDFFYDPTLEEGNNRSDRMGAINFELSCRAANFIGLSRSTFSNLISLKRFLLNKNKSFIYNWDNRIIERVDKGLYPQPDNAIKNNVTIV